jgi:hypothetical protein
MSYISEKRIVLIVSARIIGIENRVFQEKENFSVNGSGGQVLCS